MIWTGHRFNYQITIFPYDHDPCYLYQLHVHSVIMFVAFSGRVDSASMSTDKTRVDSWCFWYCEWYCEALDGVESRELEMTWMTG